MTRVAVLGAGTMGRGIAHVAAAAGFDVTLRDVDAGALERARRMIDEAVAKGVQLGKVTSAQGDATRARIRPVTELKDALADATWVIEAVPETLDLKQRVLGDAERYARPDAVLATNTSSISIAAIARGLERPERCLGLHFFNPPHLLKLLEVVHHDQTSPLVLEQAVEFARRLGKEPIVVRDSPGFASSRLGLALGLEAIRMLESGVATAADIDKAMELGYNHPMGPLRLTDLVGLDVRLAIAETLHRDLHDERFRPPELLRRLVREGKLGKKTGQGFYAYDAPVPADRATNR